MDNEENSSEPADLHDTGIIQHSSNHKKCVICGLKSVKSSGVSFHRFPKNCEMSDKWAHKTGLKFVINATPIKRFWNFRVCSHHFDESDYCNSSKKRLKPGAVPSVIKNSTNIDISSLRKTLAENLSDKSMMEDTEKDIIRNTSAYRTGVPVCTNTLKREKLEHIVTTIKIKIEEGSPMGGGECSESPAHIMEPQVELDEELDHPPLEPNVELVEPHVELEEGTDQSANVYPLDTLSVEFYEGAEDAHQDESSIQNFHENEATINGLSHDSEDTSVDAAIHDNSQCNSVDDTSLDADEITMDNSDAMDSSLKEEEEEDNTNYNEMQRTYLEGFFSSSASASVDESSNPSFERIPLSRFPSIVKVVERAEYETIQILYQLLYQRSAWDTQEILSKRILEFSGFNFNKTSEEYYNREVTLQTLPNSVLVKIGAILCLDQVKNVLSNVGLGRHDLINAILEFLAVPRKKSRAPRLINDTKSVSKEPVEPCGCRSNCLSKFTAVEREFIATYHTTLKGKRLSDSYFLNLIQVNKSSKKPGEDSKKHRDYKYSYKIKLGRKEVQVCKGGFMMLHNVKMSKLNHIQTRLKSGNFPKALLMAAEYPAPEGTEEPEEILIKPDEKSDVSNECSVENSASNSVEDSSESSSSKLEDVSIGNEENVIKVDEEIKKSLSKKVPAVLVEKIDPSKISSKKENVTGNDDSSSNKDKENSTDSVSTTDENVKMKLKDFPLVVKCLDEVSEELLIDLHFLLFLTSAENNKLKENILEFSGFSFDADCEEYDERNEFLQRMSGKLITDVARSFSLGVLSKREETIQNILSFLMKPDESFLRTNASVPVILSDVELDDIEGFSDSDESITCEVVEKKVECIDLLSSGEDSDKEDRKSVPIKKEKVDPTPSLTNVPTTVSTTATNSVADKVTAVPSTEAAASSQSKSSGGIRRLKDFETIRKIVNTHPPEYLVDIYELLFLKKHEPATLRNEILDFSGFTFEKGSPDYVKRRLVLDRMLYNNVRRVYNTLIHNSTEVKVFSKPTMINEIFQFLFKLPDHDTSVRPLPPGAKTLMPKTPVPAAKTKSTPIPNTPPTAVPASILPSQTGKLSDLKRVFQRVACFPCEYLVDVHKLLFMSDCDPKVIRQNIFGFKGFSFAVDSPEFQQRKMYLEYLTFHSLRKISSVLTTRSVDLRNSTKHELASHLTDVLAEYCNTLVETATPMDTSTSDASGSTNTTTTSTVSNSVSTSEASSVENIVITPVIEGFKSAAPSNSKKSNTKSSASNSLNISIVETRSISSPTVSTTANSSASKGSSPAKGNSSTKASPSAKGSRKRKSQTTYKRQGPPEKKTPPPPPPPAPTDFADIHLPEVEQYRQIYGANLNVYPSVPTITGIASFGSPVTQTFPQLVPQAMTFPLVSPYPQTLQVSGMQQSAPMLGLQSTGITMSTPIITQVSTKLTETIVPADIEVSEDTKSQIIPSNEKADIPKSPSKESSGKDSSPSKDSEEDGDKPLSSLIGHPMDSVLKKHICDIVEKTDLQDITMNGVIKRIYDMYPKFDLSYRKEFIKSTLRSILYKLGENSEKKESGRDSNSPDCSVTTSDIKDCSLPGSPVTNT